MAKIIMHIDLNAFFATAETIKDPSLIGKPLIIAGTTRRGIVSTASYEARKYGIKSAMPTYMARRLCPEVIIRSSDFELYHRLSQDFFSYIKRYTNIIEIASIDECYADMTECMKNCSNPEQFLKELQDNLYKETKLLCSIGLAPTKFLAKMASDIKKPMGITIIRRKDIKKILWPIKIEDMYGIGKKTAPKLKELGIHTIKEFALNESKELKKVLGVNYQQFKDWVYGKGSDEVIVEQWDPKSVGHSSTFLFDTVDYEEIKQMIYVLSQGVSKDATKQNKIGKKITLIIKNSEFKSFSKGKTIDYATNKFEDIYKCALELYNEYFEGKLIRLIGVTLSNLTNKEDYQEQTNFFNLSKHQEECKTRIIINQINNKMNKEMLIPASKLKKE